ncbi:MAG: ATP-binding protein, partial [Treponema sp.]|nr:ATP-binding protein [Treponema sp.]
MKLFDNLKIRNKLFILFGVLLAITFFFDIFALTRMKNMGDNLNELINSYEARRAYVADANTDVLKIRFTNMSKGYLLEENLQKVISDLGMDYENTIISFAENMSAFRTLVLSDDKLTEQEKQQQIAIVNEIMDLFSHYVDIIGELDNATASHDKNEMLNIVEKGIPVGNDLSGKVSELHDLIFSMTKQKTSDTQNAYSRTMYITSVASFVFMLFGIFILLATIRSIIRPILNLEKSVVEIAKGKLNYPIRSERKDELGSLANCIGDMIDKLVNYNKMTAILDNLDSMIYVSDFNYNLLYANKSMAESFGFEREACIGQKCYKVMREYDAPCSFCRIPEFSQSNEPLPCNDYEYMWDDYLKSWISGSDSDIRWSDGSTVFFRYFRDAAQKKRQEELLQETLKIAELASSSKSSFLANMSHEIRTPMNAILGITEILLSEKTLVPYIRDALNRIYNSGDLLLGIINDILDLSKIEAGKLELNPAKYEVASMINDTVSLNMMRANDKPIEFQLAVDKDIPATLIGDDLRIKQVLNNLLSNAFKYTKSGIVKLSVSTEKENEDIDTNVKLILRVSDTGQGMTEEQVKLIFDEYTRFNSDENRSVEGTGLGMGISKNLINLMNGKISVKSELNWGTIITVVLPQGKVDSRVIGNELAESLQNFKLNDAKEIRKAQIVYEPMPYGSVLIVDNEETNLYVAKGLMAPYSLTIDTATSGFEALDKINGGKLYDIIFMDHMMPKMDGMEATDRIRKLGYSLPIVALTANAVAGQAEMFLANGFDAFISKPIDTRQLNTVLKQFVRDKQPPEVIEAARQQAIEQKKQKVTAKAPKSIDPKLVKFFIRDASKALAVLEKIYPNDGVYNAEDLKAYIINVHGMKSALIHIGETELSSVAAKLERDGR